MKLRHPTKVVSLTTAIALTIVASTPAITSAQALERPCPDDANCAIQVSPDEIIGEPPLRPQPEVPVQIDAESPDIQTLPEEITFQLSVSTVLRVLNDLDSSVGNLN